FWIIQDGTIVSPPGRSILRGVTREVVFELARQLGIPTREADFQVYDVMNADEAFISVTSKCVVPATRVNGRPIGDGKPGPIVARLQNGWAERFGVDFVAQALSHLREAEAQGKA